MRHRAVFHGSAGRSSELTLERTCLRDVEDGLVVGNELHSAALRSAPVARANPLVYLHTCTRTHTLTH